MIELTVDAYLGPGDLDPRSPLLNRTPLMITRRRPDGIARCSSRTPPKQNSPCQVGEIQDDSAVDSPGTPSKESKEKTASSSQIELNGVMASAAQLDSFLGRRKGIDKLDKNCWKNLPRKKLDFDI